MTTKHYHYKRLVIMRLVAENLFLLLLQFMGMKFCIFSSPTLPINFAAGTAAAFIFMRGYTILPGIWLGTFIACMTSAMLFSSSCLLASVYTLQTAVLFWVALRYISPGLVFISKKLFLRFVLLCSLLAFAFSPLLPWQGNLAGLLIVTLALTYWDMHFPEIDRWRYIPNLCAVGLFFIAALIINLTSLFVNPINNIAFFIALLCIGTIFTGIRQPDMK